MMAAHLYQTKTCIFCAKPDFIMLDPAKVARWEAGEHVPEVWPDATASQREQLISGTHPACWDGLFAGEEE